MIWKVSKSMTLNTVKISSSLSETYYVLEDISKRLEAIIEDLDFDGNRLMQVENRLDLLHTITRKYGGTVDDVLLYFGQDYGRI